MTRFGIAFCAFLLAAGMIVHFVSNQSASAYESSDICSTDITIKIDGKRLLVPRTATIYKTDWLPVENTGTDCSNTELERVKKVYKRNLKISSAEDYYSPHQTWWDWRKYEMSVGHEVESKVPDLRLIQIPEMNKEIFIYEGGAEFTKNNEPIFFDCYGLESQLANQSPYQEGAHDDEELGFDKYDLFSNEGKYCYTSYLHKSGLVYSYGFLRKAFKAEYTPMDYIGVDQIMRGQLNEYLNGAKNKARNVKNFTKDVVTYRFAGSSDKHRMKQAVSYDCVGGVTVHIGDNHIRVPRSNRGSPVYFQPRIKDIGRIGGNPGDPIAALPQNDCSVEYVDNVTQLDQVWGPYSFYEIGQGNVESKDANSPVDMKCSGVFCSDSYIHPAGFGVRIEITTKNQDDLNERAAKLKEKVDIFLVDASLIPPRKDND